jgi:hypothetical protein
LKYKYFFLFFLFSFYFESVKSENIECQGAKLRIINKITTQKNTYIIPLSQTLELDNAKLKVFRCVKSEMNGVQDEIAILSHQSTIKKNDSEFLGWIFKSSQYINSPVNANFDIKLIECLVNDPIFLKKNSSN